MSTALLKQAATGQVAQRPKTIIDYLNDDRVAKGLAVVAGKLLQPDRLLRLCINAVKKTPKLLECDPQTVLGAMMTSAALGLEPNTVQQQAFLIPYKRRAKVRGEWVDVYDCQFQIGARGFITLGYRSPEIARWDARCIHDGDHWKERAGSQTLLEHSVALRNRGEPIGAYSHVVLENGNELALILPLDEIEKIRSRSETYRALVTKVLAAQNSSDAKELEKAQRNLAETPWSMWFDDMAEKSAIKKHAKKLPIAAGESLASAAEIDSRADEGVLDLAAMTDPDLVRAVVADETDAPALENSPSETLPASNETFGTAQRQAEPVQQEAQTASKPSASRRRAAAPPPPDQPAGEQAEAGPASDAAKVNDFINRIDDAADVENASAILAQAKNSGLSAADLKTVQEAFDMAWSDQPGA